MNGSTRVLYGTKDGIARIPISRPEKLNALARKTVQEIDRFVASAGQDPSIGVLIVTGAGEKAFVAGADIGELASQTPVEGTAYGRAGQAVLDRLKRHGKPSIAAINGYALGGGLELAMACTLRVAAESAKLGQPEVALGIIPGYGGTQRLARLVGAGRALEMILTGEPIDAREALRIGLLNRVVPAAELLPAAEALARTILTRGPVALPDTRAAGSRDRSVRPVRGERQPRGSAGLHAAGPERHRVCRRSQAPPGCRAPDPRRPRWQRQGVRHRGAVRCDRPAGAAVGRRHRGERVRRSVAADRNALLRQRARHDLHGGRHRVHRRRPLGTGTGDELPDCGAADQDSRPGRPAHLRRGGRSAGDDFVR